MIFRLTNSFSVSILAFALRKKELEANGRVTIGRRLATGMYYFEK